jgi:hypothetical protein
VGPGVAAKRDGRIVDVYAQHDRVRLVRVLLVLAECSVIDPHSPPCAAKSIAFILPGVKIKAERAAKDEKRIALVRMLDVGRSRDKVERVVPNALARARLIDFGTSRSTFIQ